MRKILAISLTLAFGLTALAAVPVMAEDFEGDQSYIGNTTIGADDTVKGNVTITNGKLTVLGTIERNVLQMGSNGVVVDGDGIVEGNIDEKSGGWVTVKDKGIVEGNIAERGNGSISTSGESLVKGNVSERSETVDPFGHDDVTIGGKSLVEGNVSEKDAGDVTVTKDAFVKCNVKERGPGNCDAVVKSSVDGNVRCR